MATMLSQRWVSLEVRNSLLSGEDCQPAIGFGLNMAAGIARACGVVVAWRKMIEALHLR